LAIQSLEVHVFKNKICCGIIIEILVPGRLIQRGVLPEALSAHLLKIFDGLEKFSEALIKLIDTAVTHGALLSQRAADTTLLRRRVFERNLIRFPSFNEGFDYPHGNRVPMNRMHFQSTILLPDTSPVPILEMIS